MVDGESSDFEVDGEGDTTHTATEEETGEAGAPETATLPALNLPRGAAWLMEQAAILKGEAARYGSPQYGTADYTVKSALLAAASALRSAVGHAIAGEGAE